MKRLLLIIALILTGLYLNAKETNCAQLSGIWKSEKEAMKVIENTIFEVSETVVPDYKSWLTSAHFYSCDGNFGYLIIKGKKKTFVHQNVPASVWESLKNAKSKGGFYNFYIKNKYSLQSGKSNTVVL